MAQWPDQLLQMAAGGSLLTSLWVGKQRAGDTNTQLAFFFLSLCSVPTLMHRMPPATPHSRQLSFLSWNLSGNLLWMCPRSPR